MYVRRSSLSDRVEAVTPSMVLFAITPGCCCFCSRSPGKLYIVGGGKLGLGETTKGEREGEARGRGMVVSLATPISNCCLYARAPKSPATCGPCIRAPMTRRSPSGPLTPLPPPLPPFLLRLPFPTSAGGSAPNRTSNGLAPSRHRFGLRCVRASHPAGAARASRAPKMAPAMSCRSFCASPITATSLRT